MEAILEILAALFLWRLLLSVGGAALLAFALSQIFAGFTAGYCVSLVLVGVAFGILWHSRAESGISLTAPLQPTPISKPVAFLGFMLIGFFWGGIASWAFASPILGGIALACSVGIVGVWYRLVLRRSVSIGYLSFACTSLLFGFALLLLIQTSNAQNF